MARLICRLVFWFYAALYLLALFVFAVGVFGWFGAEPDPLSGIYLVLIGQPWFFLIDALPEAAWPYAAALAPALNLGLLHWLCRVLGRRQTR